MAMERLTSERLFHDRQAQLRAVTFRQMPEQLLFDERNYLDHEPWVRPAFERLGDVQGLDVLDLGCGHGMASLVLSQRQARVTAIDLSSGYLQEAGARARANHAAIQFVQADGERLPFGDGTFDRVWGHAVLHHLNLQLAAKELYRVLRPGAIAVFCEPWGENPLLTWARRKLHYNGKDRTSDEQPLRQVQIRTFERLFPEVNWQGYQLLGMIGRVVKFERIMAGLKRCDAILLGNIPALERFCRYIVLTLKR